MQHRTVNLFLNILFCLSSKIWHLHQIYGYFEKRSLCELDQDGASMTIMHQLLRFIEL